VKRARRGGLPIFYPSVINTDTSRGAFYWSPEWYAEEMWRAFALFRETGDAKEGFKAFHSVFPEDDLPLRRRERD